MVGTKIIIDQQLGNTVHLFHSVAEVINAADIFRRSEMLVIDGIEWDGMEEARKGLTPVKRGFKSPFKCKSVPQEASAGLERMTLQADQIFAAIYPTIQVAKRDNSFRPMITGPEPMHFDTYDKPLSVITSFVNLSDKARRYRVGPSFETLVATQAEAMREVIAECKGDLVNLSFVIRNRTRDNQPPICRATSYHSVEFAPGAIWFFNAKTMSHEVIYGDGALGFGWDVINSGAPTQVDLVKGLL